MGGVLAIVALLLAACGDDGGGPAKPTGPVRLVDAPAITLKSLEQPTEEVRLRVESAGSAAPRTDNDIWWSVLEKNAGSRELVIAWLDAASGYCAADVASITETDRFVEVTVTSTPGRLPRGEACAMSAVRVRATLELAAPLGRRHVQEVARCRGSC